MTQTKSKFLLDLADHPAYTTGFDEGYNTGVKKVIERIEILLNGYESRGLSPATTDTYKEILNHIIDTRDTLDYLLELRAYKMNELNIERADHPVLAKLNKLIALFS